MALHMLFWLPLALPLAFLGWALTRRARRSPFVAPEKEPSDPGRDDCDASANEDRLLERGSQFVTVRGKRLRVYHFRAFSSTAPVIFFIHGAGGQAEQWREQLAFYNKRATLVAVDLVGHGKSEVAAEAERYSIAELAEDVREIFEMHAKETNILVAHSYGTSIVAALYPRIAGRVAAAVLLSPSLSRADSGEALPRRASLLRLPPFALDLVRRLDRRGGIDSSSVARMVDRSASAQLKQRQLAWNGNTASFVVKQVFSQLQPATLAEYRRMQDVPVLLVVGKKDQVSSCRNGELIKSVLTGNSELHLLPDCGHQVMLEKSAPVDALVTHFLTTNAGVAALSPRKCLGRSSSFPEGAKWGVKNYEKWYRTEAFGKPVGKHGFVALKVPRHDDPDHSPHTFHEANPRVGLVIDISLEAPPYLATECSFRYAKAAAQSKVEPQPAMVANFIRVCDAYWQSNPDSQIGVHCHYGFNRTGFLICAYLVEREGMDVDAAIQAFAEARPPGIKHEHFKQELRRRYKLRDSGRA